ncbi:ubiquitin-like domain-containing protein [Desulfitobacterium sp. THU1]|uniref:3D domain-containing protein n=1 Tax=Desulfitobacterium sp. THU1 TaxID=3138072 RepID=UPI00311E4340
MLEKTRTSVFSLVRSSRKAQISVTLLTVVFIVASVFLLKAKTFTVEIDGGKQSLTTLHSSVGVALERSKLGIYPEDIVEPNRGTLVSKGLEVKVTRSVPVELTVDGQLYSGRTTAPTVGEALEDLSNRLGLNLKVTDEVNIDRESIMAADAKLEVRRAVPIKVQVDAQEINTYLAPRTVEEALEKLEIVLSEKDKVSLPMNHMLEAEDEIRVVRVEEKVETIKSEVPYQTVAQAGDFPVGLPDRIVTRGTSGEHEQVVKITLEDGKEVSRQVLRQEVLRAPVTQVVSRGSQTKVSRGGQTIEFKRAYLMRATAYSGGGVTATGHNVRYGTIAVDPRVIPLGTKVYVEGYGEATALDTGGAIKGNRVDLYMNTEAAAWSWGVRSVVVYVK